MPISGAPLSGAVNPLSLRTRKQRGKKKSLVCLAAPDFFPDSLPASCGALAPSGCVHAANPSPLPGIHWSWSLSSQPLPIPAGEPTSLLGWWVLVGTDPLCGNLFALPSAPMLLRSPLWLRRSPLRHLQSPPAKELLVCGNLSSFTAPSHWCRSRRYSLVSVSSFFFCPTQVRGEFLAFWEVWGLLPEFSRCSVGVVPHVDVFLMYLWGGRWSPRLTFSPSWSSPGRQILNHCATREVPDSYVNPSIFSLLVDPLQIITV